MRGTPRVARCLLDESNGLTMLLSPAGAVRSHQKPSELRRFTGVQELVLAWVLQSLGVDLLVQPVQDLLHGSSG